MLCRGATTSDSHACLALQQQLLCAIQKAASHTACRRGDDALINHWSSISGSEEILWSSPAAPRLHTVAVCWIRTALQSSAAFPRCYCQNLRVSSPAAVCACETFFPLATAARSDSPCNTTRVISDRQQPSCQDAVDPCCTACGRLSGRDVLALRRRGPERKRRSSDPIETTAARARQQQWQAQQDPRRHRPLKTQGRKWADGAEEERGCGRR